MSSKHASLSRIEEASFHSKLTPHCSLNGPVESFGPAQASAQPESTLDEILDKIESIFKRQEPTVEAFGPEIPPPESTIDKILDKIESIFRRSEDWRYVAMKHARLFKRLDLRKCCELTRVISSINGLD